MSSLGDRLRARIASGAPKPIIAPKPPPPKKKIWEWGLPPPVDESPELERILSVPRRTPPEPTPEECEAYTQTVRRPGGTRVLRPVQVAALKEAAANDGFLGPIGIGQGKTDITVLLPVVMKSKVAVLLVPPSLKSKLLEIEYPALAKEYKVPNCDETGIFYPDTTSRIHVVSYSQLSNPRTADILDRLKPDLVIGDEIQLLKDPKAARTKRVLRFFRSNPHVRLCALSGSITTRSIRDFAHIAKFALKEHSPLPRDWPTLEAWAGALDPIERVGPPGALLRLCKPGESVRQGFQRRLVETPGVVATRDNALLTRLEVHERKTTVPKVVLDALDVLRAEWKTPGGVTFDDALTLYRHARQLAAGLYLKWVWPKEFPIDERLEWLEARAEWCREVRENLKGEGKPGMDSPFLLKQAHLTGKWRSTTFDRWSDADSVFREKTGRNMPQTVDVWVDDWLVKDSVEFGKEKPCILWYEHPDFGTAVARQGGFPLYGEGKSASAGIGLEKGDRTIVASLNAHHKGHNLQGFNRMLFSDSCPTSSTLWEQGMGRCHRSGQANPVVSVYVRQHTPEMRKALRDAIEDARFVEETTGGTQKLLYCDFRFDLE